MGRMKQPAELAAFNGPRKGLGLEDRVVALEVVVLHLMQHSPAREYFRAKLLSTRAIDGEFHELDEAGLKSRPGQEVDDG